jgi:hypothetical protein
VFKVAWNAWASFATFPVAEELAVAEAAADVAIASGVSVAVAVAVFVEDELDEHPVRTKNAATGRLPSSVRREKELEAAPLVVVIMRPCYGARLSRTYRVAVIPLCAALTP